MYPERAGFNLLLLSFPVQDGEEEGDDCRTKPEDAHVGEVVCSPTPKVSKMPDYVAAAVIPDAGGDKKGTKCRCRRHSRRRHHQKWPKMSCGRCLSVDVVLPVKGAVHLAENLEVRLAVKYGGAIYGVVYQEVLDSVHDDDLIVIRE